MLLNDVDYHTLGLRLRKDCYFGLKIYRYMYICTLMIGLFLVFGIEKLIWLKWKVITYKTKTYWRNWKQTTFPGKYCLFSWSLNKSITKILCSKYNYYDGFKTPYVCNGLTKRVWITDKRQISCCNIKINVNNKTLFRWELPSRSSAWCAFGSLSWI